MNDRLVGMLGSSTEFSPSSGLTPTRERVPTVPPFSLTFFRMWSYVRPITRLVGPPLFLKSRIENL